MVKIATGATYWFITLLVFNTLLLSFMGTFGSTFADDSQVQEYTNIGVPNVAINIILGFGSMPSWLNTLFAIQGIVAIYLLVATVLGGS